jgi:hypothetical protein
MHGVSSKYLMLDAQKNSILKAVGIIGRIKPKLADALKTWAIFFKPKAWRRR